MTFLTLSFLLYFLPAILASSRRHPAAGAIWLTNFFLGWTLIGWVVCLVWALSVPPVPQIPVAWMPVVPANPGWATAPPPAYPNPGTAAQALAVAPVPQPGQSVLCGACLRPLDPTARFCPMCGSSYRTPAA